MAEITTPDHKYVIKIDADERRPNRRRYRWQLFEWSTENYWGDKREPGWYPLREEVGGFEALRDLKGYAKTMRAAEQAARHALVPFQIVSPHGGLVMAEAKHIGVGS